MSTLSLRYVRIPTMSDKHASARGMTESDFVRFYEDTASRLQRYLVRLAGDVDVAEDILQESYLAFLRNPRSFER